MSTGGASGGKVQQLQATRPRRKRLTACTLTTCALAAAVLSGCGAASDTAAGFTRTDSAGITLAVTEGSLGRAPLPWLQDTVPDLTIGESGGDERYVFDRIGGVTTTADGRLLVVDGGTAELRFYDATGQHLITRGGQGSGPGEFTAPRYLHRVGGDSLLFFDTRRRHFTIYSADADGFREFGGDLPRPARAGSIRGVVGDKLVGSVGGELPFTDGLSSSSSAVKLVDLSTANTDTLLKAPVQFFRTTIAGVPYLLESPWTFRPAVAVTDSLFYGSLPGGARVAEYQPDGSLRRLMRLAEPPLTVTPERFEAVLDEIVGDHREEGAADARRGYEELGVGDPVPAFDRLLTDDVGWVWSRIHQPRYRMPEEWMVFSPEGRAAGVLSFPDGFELTAANATHALGIWRDEFDTESVRRYRLERDRR